MAVTYFNIFKSRHGLCSHFDTCLITLQLHISYNNIITSHFTGSCFKTKRIITTDNITITNTYMLTTINIDTIIVGHSKTSNRYIIDIDIAALKIM